MKRIFFPLKDGDVSACHQSLNRATSLDVSLILFSPLLTPHPAPSCLSDPFVTTVLSPL